MRRAGASIWIQALVFGILLNAALFFLIPSLVREYPPPSVQVVKPFLPINTSRRDRPEPAPARELPPEEPPRKTPEMEQPPERAEVPPPELRVQLPRFRNRIRAAAPEPVRVPPPPRVARAPAPPAPPAVMPVREKAEFDVGEVDRPPRVVSRIDPLYPYAARRKRLRGKVVARCLVSREGEATRVRVVASEPRGIFDEAVLTALRRWKFEPGTYKGKAVATWIEIPFRFDLKG